MPVDLSDVPDWLPDVLHTKNPKDLQVLQQRSAFVLGSDAKYPKSPGDASARDLWQICSPKLLNILAKLLTQFPKGIAQTACDPRGFAFARHFRKWWKLTPKLCYSPILRN